MAEQAMPSMRVKEREVFDGYSNFESATCETQRRSTPMSKLDDCD